MKTLLLHTLFFASHLLCKIYFFFLTYLSFSHFPILSLLLSFSSSHFLSNSVSVADSFMAGTHCFSPFSSIPVVSFSPFSLTLMSRRQFLRYSFLSFFLDIPMAASPTCFITQTSFVPKSPKYHMLGFLFFHPQCPIRTLQKAGHFDFQCIAI